MALNYVTVTGTFDDGSGNPLPAVGQSAYCLFTPSTSVYASGVPLITPAQPIQAPIINGALSQRLLATDNAGLTFGGLTGFFYWTVTLVIAGQASPAWSFFLPHTPTTVDLSALANTAAGGSGGFTNPMTTLGDLISGGASGAAVRLAGDTSNTRKFLRELSSGGVATAPVWDTIQAGDLPSGTGFQAWQFLPETYGAKGDGKVVADVSTTSGSKVITSATAAFTAGDVGKKVMINGGNGAAATPVLDTIASVQSATQATLTTNNAGATASSCQMVWGTDDTAAVNSAVSAASTYALANNYYAEVVFGAKIYVLASGPTQTSTPVVQNAQIPLPHPAVNGTSQKLVIALTGRADTSQVQYWESVVPNLAGTCLVSMTTAPSTIDPTFGRQSVIGGPSGSSGLTGGFANVKPIVSGIMVVCPVITNQVAFDFGFCGGFRMDGVSAQVFAPAANLSAASAAHPYMIDLPPLAGFQSSKGAGLRAPLIQNNDDCAVTSFTCEGYETGVMAQDHLTCLRLATLFCDIGVLVDITESASNISHNVTIAQWSCENVNVPLRSNGGGGSYCAVNIVLDGENAAGGFDVNDSGNTLYGVLHWSDLTHSTPLVNGAANLKVINDKLGPGFWSGAPAAPASTSSQQNTAWRDAWITLSATTGITAITVDGQATGLTAGNNVATTIRLPAGKSYAVTYTGTLTAKWWLD